MSNAETLITYRTFPISAQASMGAIVDACGNEPIELVGVAPFSLLMPLVARLRDFATEIVYREAQGTAGTIVFSLHEPGIRPYAVAFPPSLTEEEERACMRNRAQDTRIEIEVDIDALWRQAQASEPEQPLHAFILSLQSVEPVREAVILTGETPVIPAILAMMWFLSDAKTVRYEQIALKS